MILFRKNPPGVPPPAASTSPADDLPDPLTMALINLGDHNIKMALSYFNDAVASTQDDRQRAEAFREFGNAVATSPASDLLAQTYLETALALAVDIKDDDLTEAIRQDLLLLDQS